MRELKFPVNFDRLPIPEVNILKTLSVKKTGLSACQKSKTPCNIIDVE